ncbi:hypothetical protein T11_9709 [Trichinella zimbabwensis]|uniref:Uncharacterized protein n=1 Tax=Trichinella zimbabwensis TaxID=268475 RepID=A0A0V1FJV0_9BILA|nr:hypothetical protein T11_9709 [Trichinella zimbabwensis]
MNSENVSPRYRLPRSARNRFLCELFYRNAMKLGTLKIHAQRSATLANATH